MRIFISGASGLVGGNCLKHFQEKQCDVVGSHLSFPTENTVYFNTLHLKDKNNFDLLQFHPEIIIHCGALTHVDYCEAHIEESYEKTVSSTQNLIQIAKQLQAQLVYISTDYVFDGEHGPYRENDKVNPLSIYAKHKLEAEQIVLNSDEKNLVIRITNVYGEEQRNKNFVSRIISQCLQNEKINLRLPYDQYATPILAYDVARALYFLLNDKHHGIFHLASSDFMNRVELANRVLKYFPNAVCNLESLKTEQLQQAAKRPLISGLIKEKFSSLYPDFQFSNVDDFVKKYI